MLVNLRDFFVDQQTALPRLHHHHPRPVVAEAQNLQCAGIAEQADKLLGYELFGTDGFGNVENAQAVGFLSAVCRRMQVFQIFRRTHAGDAAGNIEQVGGDFAGDDIGFVAAGQCQQQVGIGRARLFEDKRGCAVAHYGLHVQPAADSVQRFFV